MVVWGHGRGKALGALSSSCSCWSADHLWAIVTPGMGDIGDAWWDFRLAVGNFMSFAF